MAKPTMVWYPVQGVQYHRLTPYAAWDRMLNPVTQIRTSRYTLSWTEPV